MSDIKSLSGRSVVDFPDGKGGPLHRPTANQNLSVHQMQSAISSGMNGKPVDKPLHDNEPAAAAGNGEISTANLYDDLAEELAKLVETSGSAEILDLMRQNESDALKTARIHLSSTQREMERVCNEKDVELSKVERHADILKSQNLFLAKELDDLNNRHRILIKTFLDQQNEREERIAVLEEQVQKAQLELEEKTLKLEALASEHKNLNLFFNRQQAAIQARDSS